MGLNQQEADALTDAWQQEVTKLTESEIDGETTADVDTE
jgi:hypothetical protein